MVSNEQCLQVTDGPTPCFREAGSRICDLSFCEAREYFESHPEKGLLHALNHHCPITHPWDYRGKFKSIQLARIAENAARNKR